VLLPSPDAEDDDEVEGLRFVAVNAGRTTFPPDVGKPVYLEEG
jgi:hypothetical protein